MTTPEPERDVDGDAMLRAAGFNLTAEGQARARKLRDEFEARWTPEKWAALREQLGLPRTSA